MSVDYVLQYATYIRTQTSGVQTASTYFRYGQHSLILNWVHSLLFSECEKLADSASATLFDSVNSNGGDFSDFNSGCQQRLQQQQQQQQQSQSQPNMPSFCADKTFSDVNPSGEYQCFVPSFKHFFFTLKISTLQKFFQAMLTAVAGP